MASTTAVASKKRDLALQALAGEIGDLNSILAEQESNQLSEVERDVRAMEWGQVMGTLRVVLDPAYHAGQMTREQEERYRELLRRLREALPVIEKLRFPRPPVSLEPRAG